MSHLPWLTDQVVQHLVANHLGIGFDGITRIIETKLTTLPGRLHFYSLKVRYQRGGGAGIEEAGMEIHRSAITVNSYNFTRDVKIFAAVLSKLCKYVNNLDPHEIPVQHKTAGVVCQMYLRESILEINHRSADEMYFAQPEVNVEFVAVSPPAKSGFSTFNADLNQEHLNAVLVALGKFHAMGSIFLQDWAPPNSLAFLRNNEYFQLRGRNASALILQSNVIMCLMNIVQEADDVGIDFNGVNQPMVNRTMAHLRLRLEEWAEPKQELPEVLGLFAGKKTNFYFRNNAEDEQNVPAHCAVGEFGMMSVSHGCFDYLLSIANWCPEELTRHTVLRNVKTYIEAFIETYNRCRDDNPAVAASELPRNTAKLIAKNVLDMHVIALLEEMTILCLTAFVSPPEQDSKRKLFNCVQERVNIRNVPKKFDEFYQSYVGMKNDPGQRANYKLFLSSVQEVVVAYEERYLLDTIGNV